MGARASWTNPIARLVRTRRRARPQLALPSNRPLRRPSTCHQASLSDTSAPTQLPRGPEAERSMATRRNHQCRGRCDPPATSHARPLADRAVATKPAAAQVTRAWWRPREQTATRLAPVGRSVSPLPHQIPAAKSRNCFGFRGFEQLQQIDFSLFPLSPYRKISFLNFNIYVRSAPAD